MKLLIDLQAAQTDSRYRGIGRQARSLVTSLIAASGAHDIFVLLNAGLTGGFDELRYGFLKALPPENVKVFGVPGPVREMETGNLWRMRTAELLRETFIADLKPDVLYVSSLFEGVTDDAVTSIGLMEAPFATAVTLFDLIPLADPAAYLAAGFMRRFYYRRAQSLKRADRLIAISAFAKQEAVELLQIPEDRIDVALLGVDPSFRRCDLTAADAAALRAKYGLPEAFIFYVGAIEPRKNIPLIIEAFGKLTPAQRGDVALVFGGRLSDVERGQLLTAAVRFGVEPARLILPGYVAEVDLAPLYSMSRLFVFPSIQEGFGLPPLEAMACGTPVLVARNSSLPEVVGRDDQMFGTFDAGELAVKMARILRDHAYADELREWGVGRAAGFTWQRAASETLTALEDLHDRHRASGRHQVALRSKPRLAFVSPLPSDRTGIASYASELLRELGCYYDVECVIEGSSITDPWVIANFPLRDVAFFRKHAASYDYILYQIGNSQFHAHLLDLVALHPGVVVLHDFFLSGLLDWLGNIGERPEADFLQQLYLTHGLPALAYAEKEGRHQAAERYPTNQLVFANSHGVIVHSRWAIDRARDIYGDAVAERMIHLPHLRAAPTTMAKADARRKLGLQDDALVVSTFGFVAETKFGDMLASAWVQSAAGRQAGASLVFVGDHPPGPWGEAFDQHLARLAGDVSIAVTGFASNEDYALYLAASDIAIQLRRQTRGETSGAVLDCMGAGLPLIVNAHGPAAEIDPACVLLLPDAFSTDELAEAIDLLAFDSDLRAVIGSRARDLIQRRHHPSIVGVAMRDAIHRFSTTTNSARLECLLGATGELYAPVSPNEADLASLSQVVATSFGWDRPGRVFFDVTLLSDSDAHTGIERVTRGFLNQMLAAAPAGLRVEAVRWVDGQLVYARRYLAAKFAIPADVLPDTPIDYRAGDMYVTLEWGAYLLPQMEAYLRLFRRMGGCVVIGIYDLLPLQLPHRFPDGVSEATRIWFQSVLAIADHLLCDSRSVADDVLAFGNALVKTLAKPIRVDYFHPSSDIGNSVPTTGLPGDAEAFLAGLVRRPTFLMVGTVEPRKGHRQVLDAFRHLWATGVDVNLVIVGRQGWLVDDIVRAISESRENHGRLRWIQDASDDYLERLYRASSALIAASEGEGFGLPLIEAAARGLPLIVRDLPVFREVAGEGAFYFNAVSGEEMADVIAAWIRLHDTGAVPSSANVSTLRWAESVDQFFGKLAAAEAYGTIHPPVVA